MSAMDSTSDEFAQILKEKAPVLLQHVDSGDFDAAVSILTSLQQARMPQISEKEDLMTMLKDKALILHDSISSGSLDIALDSLQDMQTVRDRGLYLEVGRLTRALHDAIRNFQVDAKQQTESSEIAEATDRLGYVIELTEKAANRTMDLVEDSLPVADKLRQEASDLKKEWQRLVQRDMTPDEFRGLYWRLDEYFNSLEGGTSTLAGNMTEILMAQDYQDLTGQVINKVANLVKEIEASLVDLVFMASQVDAITGIVVKGEENTEQVDKDMVGHGPQIDKTKEDVVSSQDDVDDLLSSLGF